MKLFVRILSALLPLGVQPLVWGRVLIQHSHIAAFQPDRTKSYGKEWPLNIFLKSCIWAQALTIWPFLSYTITVSCLAMYCAYQDQKPNVKMWFLVWPWDLTSHCIFSGNPCAVVGPSWSHIDLRSLSSLQSCLLLWTVILLWLMPSDLLCFLCLCKQSAQTVWTGPFLLRSLSSSLLLNSSLLVPPGALLSCYSFILLLPPFMKLNHEIILYSIIPSVYFSTWEDTIKN